MSADRSGPEGGGDIHITRGSLSTGNQKVGLESRGRGSFVGRSSFVRVSLKLACLLMLALWLAKGG